MLRQSCMLLGHLTLLTLLLRFCFVGSNLVLHADLLLSLLNFLNVRMDHFWAGRRWSLEKIKQLSVIPLLSRAVFPKILLSKSLNRSKPALLQSTVMILLFALPPPLGILNSTTSYCCSQGCPSLYPQPVPSCLYGWGPAQPPLPDSLSPVSGSHCQTLETSSITCTLLWCHSSRCHSG